MKSHTTDCLIIGSGISGLAALRALEKHNIHATVIALGPAFEETNTYYAQGGIIYEPHNKEELFEDIVKAGGYINFKPAVRKLVDYGPKYVKEVLIDDIGIAFDKKKSDEWDLTQEGGHRRKRILHVGDSSGKSIESSFVNHMKTKKNITWFSQHTAINLLMTSFHGTDISCHFDRARCFGAFVFDQVSHEVFPIFARHTILATGGIGEIFLHHTNSKYSRGDGIALASRAGARLMGLEYIQFHPTTFYKPPHPRFLISESLRGEGAILFNKKGERFLSHLLQDCTPPELAPRDRLACAIHYEMLESGETHVLLDISFKPAHWIQKRFPFIYQACKNAGIDITKEPIPVVPAEHYHCGGVWSDLYGKTSLDNLWAIGEVAATGLHGANRLASTSLLEGLVWGTEAGNAIALDIGQNSKNSFFIPQIEPWTEGKLPVDPSFLHQDWLTLKHTMWNYVGLIKTESRLNRALGILTELNRGISSFYRAATLSDSLIGLRHASHTALKIVKSSIQNPTSIGCYQRKSFDL